MADEIPKSRDTAKAYAALASAIERIVPGNGTRDELTAAIAALIDERITDTVNYMADRVQEATGIRP